MNEKASAAESGNDVRNFRSQLTGEGDARFLRDLPRCPAPRFSTAACFRHANHVEVQFRVRLFGKRLKLNASAVILAHKPPFRLRRAK